MAVSFGRLLSYGWEPRKVLSASTTSQWLCGMLQCCKRCKQSAAYLPVQGGWDEGSILNTTFSAYKNKKARERKALPKSHGPNVFCVAMIVLDLHLSSGHGVKLGKLETPC